MAWEESFISQCSPRSSDEKICLFIFRYVRLFFFVRIYELGDRSVSLDSEKKSFIYHTRGKKILYIPCQQQSGPSVKCIEPATKGQTYILIIAKKREWGPSQIHARARPFRSGRKFRDSTRKKITKNCVGFSLKAIPGPLGLAGLTRETLNL